MADQIIGPLTKTSKPCDDSNVKLAKPLIKVRTDLFSSPKPFTNEENIQDKCDFTSFIYPPPQIQSLEKEFEKLRINVDNPSLGTPLQSSVVSSWYSEYPFSATNLASNLTTPSTQENPWEAVGQQSWNEFFADFKLKLNRQKNPPCQKVKSVQLLPSNSWAAYNSVFWPTQCAKCDNFYSH